MRYFALPTIFTLNLLHANLCWGLISTNRGYDLQVKANAGTQPVQVTEQQNLVLTDTLPPTSNTTGHNGIKRSLDDVLNDPSPADQTRPSPTLQDYDEEDTPRIAHDRRSARRRTQVSRREDPHSQGQAFTGFPIPTQLNTAPTRNASTVGGAAVNPASGQWNGLPATNGDPTVNCSDLYTGRDNKCWGELHLNEWMQQWLIDNPCKPGEAFATCFTRKEGLWGLDCSGLKLSSCVPPMDPTLASRPEVFYVAYNIYSINQFFLTWWTAVGNAAALAANNIDDIVQILDPVSHTNLMIQEIFMALLGMIMFIAGPLAFAAEVFEFSALLGLALESALYNSLFLTQMGRFLFPTDTGQSQMVQMADLKSKLGSVVDQVQSTVNITANSAMSNSTTFLSLAASGNFTAVGVDLADASKYMTKAFNTYVISQALNGNNIYGTVARGTNPQAIATNKAITKHMSYQIDCKYYNDVGICNNDEWWYNNKTGDAYGVDNFSHMNWHYGKKLTQLFEKGYTDGDWLFTSASQCQNANGGFFNAPANVTVFSANATTGAPGGRFNAACISQMKVLTWDPNCTVDSSINKPCEFLEQKPQNTFFHPNGGMFMDTRYSVPASYLGPTLMGGESLQRT